MVATPLGVFPGVILPHPVQKEGERRRVDGKGQREGMKRIGRGKRAQGNSREGKGEKEGEEEGGIRLPNVSKRLTPLETSKSM